MSTGLSHYVEKQVKDHAESLKKAVYALLDDSDFQDAITYGPNSAKKVKLRFEKTRRAIEEILGPGIAAATNDHVTEITDAYQD